MTAAETKPDVLDVLRAVGKAALLPLVPAEDARMLAGPVARAQEGVPFTRDEEVAAARLLQGVREIIGPALAMMGVEIPAPPAPVEVKSTRSPTGRAPMVVHMVADGRIAVKKVPYSMKETMEAIAGRERDRHHLPSIEGHTWFFPPTPAGAAGLLRTLAPYAPLVSAGVRELAARHGEVLAARTVLSDDAPAPEYDGAGHVNMRLWTHQARFVEFGTVSKALCFAVKMGGGKTGGAIALANRVQAGRILIVCPDKVRPVWARESRERSSVAWHIEDGTRPKKVGKGRMDLKHPERVARATHVLFDCDCDAPVHAFVVNYEAMQEPVWQRWEPPGQVDLLVFDEAHRLKNHNAKPKAPNIRKMTPEQLAAWNAKDHARWTQSGQAAQWRKFADRAVALTGTPFPQHPWDIFGMYRALDPGIFGEKWTPFVDRYLELDRGGTFPKRIKPEMLAEFADKCMSIMYRPTVDLNLPGITDVLRTVELEAEARRHYDELDTELWTDLTAMLERQRRKRLGLPEELDTHAAGAPVELTAKNILGRLLRLQQLTGGTLRGDPVPGPDGRPVPGPEVRVSRAKARELAEILEDVGCRPGNEGGPEPVVVFTRFTSDLDAVREVAEKAKLRYAEISGRRNTGLNSDARMAEDVDVVGVNIQAGGTGIDLTRSRYAVWYSLGYSVSDYDQARARLYRPGQTRPVVNIHIQATDTQDEAVYDAISLRRAAIAEVLLAGGVAPEEVAELVAHVRGGELETEVGAALELDVHTDSEGAAVRLPWED